ncbi:MAG: hypothetical protein WA867_16180 [Candidatus Acidiferrales bacterium]
MNGIPYHDATPSSRYSPGMAGWRSIAGGAPDGGEGGLVDEEPGCGAGVVAGGCVATLCCAQPATATATKINSKASRIVPLLSRQISIAD